MRQTVGCLFAGMGGLASGLEAAGFAILWANELDSYACSTFERRFPCVELFPKDVKALSVPNDGLQPVDLLAAAFPCQSFSQAGDRRGFADPRGALFFEISRLLQEWPAEQRPRLVLLENVPHLRQGANGLWFDTIRKQLRECGYWFRESSCWTVNVKDMTGLPQDRERLFMVAASRRHFPYNPFTPPVVSHCDMRTLDQIVDRSKRGDDGAYLPVDNRYFRMIKQQMDGGDSKRNVYQLRRSYVREKKNGLCPTLTANMGIGGHNVPFVLDEWGIRRLSVAEVARLQGFEEPQFPEDIPVAERYRLLGNAVCVELARLAGKACAKALREAGR